MNGDLFMAEVTPDPRPVKRVKDRLPLKAKPKPARTKTAAETATAWRVAVLAKRNSVIWTGDDYAVIADGAMPKLHPHHIISAQCLRKHGLGAYDDTRNGVPVSERRHARHHSRLEPIRADELPDDIHQYLAENPELMPYFKRVYLGDERSALVRSAGNSTVKGSDHVR